MQPFQFALSCSFARRPSSLFAFHLARLLTALEAESGREREVGHQQHLRSFSYCISVSIFVSVLCSVSAGWRFLCIILWPLDVDVSLRIAFQLDLFHFISFCPVQRGGQDKTNFLVAGAWAWANVGAWAVQDIRVGRVGN